MKESKVWPQEEISRLTDLYVNQGVTDPYDLSEKHFPDKNHRSIISKLVQLKIYNKPERKLKDNVTVKLVVREIEKLLDVELDMVNLAKKENFIKILEGISNKLQEK